LQGTDEEWTAIADPMNDCTSESSSSSESCSEENVSDVPDDFTDSDFEDSLNEHEELCFCL